MQTVLAAEADDDETAMAAGATSDAVAAAVAARTRVRRCMSETPCGWTECRPGGNTGLDVRHQAI
jgi:hypothetical protein